MSLELVATLLLLAFVGYTAGALLSCWTFFGYPVSIGRV